MRNGRSGRSSTWMCPSCCFWTAFVEFRIDVETPDGAVDRRRLGRRQIPMGDVPGIAGCRMHEVRVGENRRFLVVQHEVDKALVLDAGQAKRVQSAAGQALARLEGPADRLGCCRPVLRSVSPPDASTTSCRWAMRPSRRCSGHVDAPFFAEIDRRNGGFRPAAERDPDGGSGGNLRRTRLCTSPGRWIRRFPSVRSLIWSRGPTNTQRSWMTRSTEWALRWRMPPSCRRFPLTARAGPACPR